MFTCAAITRDNSANQSGLPPTPLCFGAKASKLCLFLSIFVSFFFTCCTVKEEALFTEVYCSCAELVFDERIHCCKDHSSLCTAAMISFQSKGFIMNLHSQKKKKRNAIENSVKFIHSQGINYFSRKNLTVYLGSLHFFSTTNETMFAFCSNNI